MPSGRVDTMTDYCRQILGLLSEAKIVADADLPWLLSIEQQVVEKLRAPITQMQQAGIMPAGAGQVPAGGAQMDPMMALMGGGMPQPGGPSQAGMGGVRGVPTGPAIPNSDELRRVLTQNQ